MIGNYVVQDSDYKAFIPPVSHQREYLIFLRQFFRKYRARND
jgi:hypothetical protein